MVAIEYFERAALVQPGEVKWQLMVTSCYRRLGDFYKVKTLPSIKFVAVDVTVLFVCLLPLGFGALSEGFPTHIHFFIACNAAVKAACYLPVLDPRGASGQH